MEAADATPWAISRARARFGSRAARCGSREPAGVRLQRARHPDRGGRAVSRVRDAAHPCERCGNTELRERRRKQPALEAEIDWLRAPPSSSSLAAAQQCADVRQCSDPRRWRTGVDATVDVAADVVAPSDGGAEATIARPRATTRRRASGHLLQRCVHGPRDPRNCGAAGGAPSSATAGRRAEPLQNPTRGHPRRHLPRRDRRRDRRRRGRRVRRVSPQRARTRPA